MTQTALSFDGPATKADVPRLTGQIRRVAKAMQDGRWYTLGAVALVTGDPEASISAQMRHLRKDRFGGSIVERRYELNGLYSYRLTLSNRTRELLEVA